MKKFVVCLDFKFVTDNRRFFERGDSQSNHVVAVFLWFWIEILKMSELRYGIDGGIFIIMNDNVIDSIAAWGKFGVENSGRSRDEKEWVKSGVDCLSSVLKLMRESATPTMSVMGLDIEQIRSIKQIAERYAIEKVVLFPYPDGQTIIPLIRAYV